MDSLTDTLFEFIGHVFSLILIVLAVLVVVWPVWGLYNFLASTAYQIGFLPFVGLWVLFWSSVGLIRTLLGCKQ